MGDEPGNPWRSESTLRRLYYHENMSTREVASCLGTSHTTIQRWMRKKGVDPESKSRANFSADADVELLEDESEMEKMYRDDEMTAAEIADEVGCGQSTVCEYLKDHDIDRRQAQPRSPEYRVRLTGEDHPMYGRTGEDSPVWTGGSGGPGYGPNWKNKRREVLRRDRMRCRACSMSQEESRKKYGLGLDVHHIQPIKKFDSPSEANKLSNLVTLCRSCHHRWEGVPLRPISVPTQKTIEEYTNRPRDEST